MVSIGAHVYGGSFNSASVIGKYGNPYADYIAAFGLSLPNNDLNLIPVTGNETISAPLPSGYGSSTPGSIAVTGSAICEVCKSRKVETRPAPQTQHQSQAPTVPLQRPRSQHERRSTMTKLTLNGGVTQGQNLSVKSQRTESEEEGFMDVLRTVASALPTGLGIIGGPIGALAGFALNAASVVTTMTAESAMDEPAIHEGSMERAILAEATLSALQSAELPPDMEESIFSDMKDTVMRALPVIRKAAPHVMGAMMEPALKIALDSLHSHNQKAAAGAESFEADAPEPFRATALYTAAIDRPADHQAEAFLGYFQASLQQNLQESAMDADSEEGFIDIVKAGIRLAGKGVAAAAKYGLPVLLDAVKSSGGAEAFEDQPGSGPAAHLLAADPLAQRALVADAALKAVMRIPPQQLQEEGFFGFLGNAFKTIAPIAMKVAPVVAGAIHPAIGKVVSGVLRQESASVHGSTGPGRLEGIQKLAAKRSLRSLREGGAQGNESRHRFEQPGVNRSRLGIQRAH